MGVAGLYTKFTHFLNLQENQGNPKNSGIRVSRVNGRFDIILLFLSRILEEGPSALKKIAEAKKYYLLKI